MFSRNAPLLLVLSTICAFAVAPLLLSGTPRTTTDPLSPANSVLVADLLKELNNSKTAPTILFVGFKRLYASGHIKGALYHGTAGNAEGLAELKAWAASLPRSTNLVIYCGCCPIDHCPNIRPAFSALHDLGFTRLRALVLPTDFAADWADKGYPYDKGQ